MGLWIIPAVVVIVLAFVLERVARGTDRAPARRGAARLRFRRGDF